MSGNNERQDDALTAQIVAALPGTASAIAAAVGRKPSDGTVRRRLAKLEAASRAAKIDGIWTACRDLPDLGSGYVFPDDLDDESLALFNLKLAELRDQQTWKDSDADLLERYVRCLQRARLARAAAGDTPFTTGGTGRVYLHPGVSVAQQAERDAHVYADALILTPAARKRHGLGSDTPPEDDPFDI